MHILHMHYPPSDNVIKMYRSYEWIALLSLFYDIHVLSFISDPAGKTRWVGEYEIHFTW